MIRALILAFVATFFPVAASAEVEIQQIETPGGLTAWLVEDHNIPFVALELHFRGGAALDRPEKRGAGHLMMALLEEGTGDLDAQDFARETEALAASFKYDISGGAASVSAKFLTENRDQAMALLRGSLINPTFDPVAVDRVRAQVISIIGSNQNDPREVASDAFAEFVYGDHPYGMPLEGTVETVSALSRADIQTAHQTILTRERVYISAVGDITADELANLLDTLLADMPVTGHEGPPPPDINLPGGTTVKPFAVPQSIAVFAQPGIERDHPDFFAAYVLNQILGGGGFESRLTQEVREKRGLTYSVYSYLSNYDDVWLWRGSVSSSNDRIAEAIEVIRAEWDRMRTDGVTEKELQDAKTYLTGAYPLRFDGNGPIARITVGMQYDGLSPDYIANRNDYVNAVTLEDVNRVAREVLDPDALTFLVVGTPTGLE